MFFKKSWALIALLGFTACTNNPFSSFFSTDNRIAVSVEKPLIEEKQPTLSLPAILAPSEKIEIQFPIDVKTERVTANVGDSVNQGDLLFTLNEQDFILKQTQLKSQLLEKEAMAEKNGYFYKNRDRLLQEGKIDKSLYEAVESESKASDAAVEKVKADIAVVDNQLHHINFNAPFSGMITSKNMVGGVNIPAHQTVLTLVKPDPMLVVFNLPAVDTQSVQKETPVQVKVEGLGEQRFSATVTFINPELDGAHHTFEVKATLPNPKLIFKGGMQAQVQFVSPRKVKTLSIPSQAVLNDSNRDYVYVVRQNRAWRVRIYTRKNEENPNLTEIQEGLTENDIVVTKGQDQLKEGSEVNLWR